MRMRPRSEDIHSRICAITTGNDPEHPIITLRSATYGTVHVTPRGKKWYGYPRIPLREPITGIVVSNRKPIILGLRSKMTKKEAREVLAREVAKLVPLVNFDRFTLQLHVDKLAKNIARDTVLQIRAYLRDIFEEAIDQDFLIKDPAARDKVPTQLRESDKTTLTWDQLRAALDSVNAEERILLELDMTQALRPSEEGVKQMVDSMHDELCKPSPTVR
jgi:integrase